MEQTANSSSSGAGWTCDRCGTSVRDDELRCYVCGMFASPPSENASQESPKAEKAVQAQVVRCTSCQAAVTYSASAQNLRCAYCGEVTQVETPVDPIEACEGYLPFLVTPEEAEVALKKFWETRSKKNWLSRQDVSSKGKLAELRAQWWPAWVCSADAKFYWAVDTSRGSGRADYAPHSGEYEKKLEGFCICASRGITEEEGEKIVDGYDFTSVKDKPEGPEFATVECFELSRSKARQKVRDAIDRKGVQVISNEVPDVSEPLKKRMLSVATHLKRVETSNLSLPAYIVAYRYRNKLYRVVINGQNSEIAVGKVPLDPVRVILLGIISAIAIAIAIVLALAVFIYLVSAGSCFELIDLMSE